MSKLYHGSIEEVKNTEKSLLAIKFVESKELKL